MPSIWTPPRVLYSAVSSLAYLIGQRFYAKTHYVWFAPATSSDRFAPVNPPSSDPIQIYWAYHHAIATGDQHSGVIRRNRAGIADGAATRRSQQVIDSTAERTITELAPVRAACGIPAAAPGHSVPRRRHPGSPCRNQGSGESDLGSVYH